MNTLYGSSASPAMTLRQALADCATLFADNTATALLYAPQACTLAALRGGTLCDVDGHAVPLGAVFEARVFNTRAELRWLLAATGGRAAVISESADNLPDWGAANLSFFEPRSQQYLLWGEGVGAPPAPGWSRLAEARVGKLDVPIADIPAHGHVILSVCEYLKVVDDHGNVAVVEERLLNLEVIHG